MENDTRQYMIDRVTDQVKEELRRAEAIHGGFHSLHEAMAIIREEYRELEDAVFWGVQQTGSLDGIRNEAIQTAAMCIRLAVMVTQPPREAYQPKHSLTDLERRLLESLKEHIHPKYPNFCEVCYAQTEKSPEECDCRFKTYWKKALALIEECETPITSPHIHG